MTPSVETVEAVATPVLPAPPKPRSKYEASVDVTKRAQREAQFNAKARSFQAKIGKATDTHGWVPMSLLMGLAQRNTDCASWARNDYSFVEKILHSGTGPAVWCCPAVKALGVVNDFFGYKHPRYRKHTRPNRARSAYVPVAPPHDLPIAAEPLPEANAPDQVPSEQLPLARKLDNAVVQQHVNDFLALVGFDLQADVKLVIERRSGEMNLSKITNLFE